MPEMTPEQAHWFRAGIEAAAELAKAKDAEAKGYGDAHHALRALPEQIRALAPAAPEPTDAPHGYVFHNPDTGWEYAVSHPVLSGEVPDADNIRPATEFEADLCKQISRLKAAAPEPSEDDVLKVAQAIRQQIPDAEPIAIEAAARAALAAMRENG